MMLYVTPARWMPAIWAIIACMALILVWLWMRPESRTET
jgi:hypothetical protein